MIYESAAPVEPDRLLVGLGDLHQQRVKAPPGVFYKGAAIALSLGGPDG